MSENIVFLRYFFHKVFPKLGYIVKDFLRTFVANGDFGYQEWNINICIIRILNVIFVLLIQYCYENANKTSQLIFFI